jgi:hypothetical protein
MLWDFVPYAWTSWNSNRLELLYLGLVEYLVQADATLKRNKIRATAVTTSIDDRSCAALAQLGVDVKHVAGWQREEDLQELNRFSSGIQKPPAQTTTEVVMISSRKELTQAIRKLEERGIKVLVVHTVSPGSPESGILALAASETLHVSALSAFCEPQPFTKVLAPIVDEPACNGRLRGIISAWDRSRRREGMTGFVQPGFCVPALPVCGVWHRSTPKCHQHPDGAQFKRGGVSGCVRRGGAVGSSDEMET